MIESFEMLMTQTALQMVKTRPGEVCARCRDKTVCETCAFNPNPTE
jgi:hypothetical protein